METAGMVSFSHEFDDLVDLFCEGDMSPEQAHRLETLVGESAEARAYLLDSFQIHCELAWEFGRGNGDASRLPSVDEIADSHGSNPKRWQFRWWIFFVVAAGLFGAVTLGLTGVIRGG